MKRPFRFIAIGLLSVALIASSTWWGFCAKRELRPTTDGDLRSDPESIANSADSVLNADCIARLPACFAVVNDVESNDASKKWIALECVRAGLRLAIAEDFVSMRSCCADADSADVMLKIGIASMRAALLGLEGGRARLGLDAISAEDVNFLRQFVVGKFASSLDDCVAVGCDAFASVIVFTNSGPRILMMWLYDTNYDGVHSNLKNVWMCLDSACEEIHVDIGSVDPTELLALPFRAQSWDFLVSKIEYLRFLRGSSQRNTDLMEIDNPYGAESDPVSWDEEDSANGSATVDTRIIKTTFVACDELMRAAFNSFDSTNGDGWMPILAERSRRLGQFGDRNPIPFHVLCANGCVVRVYPSYVLSWSDSDIEEDRALAALIRCAYW